MTQQYDPHVEQVGGSTLRVTHGPVFNPADMAGPDALRVHTGGSTRYSMGDTEAEKQAGVVKHVEAVTGTAGSTIMSTVRHDSRGTSVELVPGVAASRTLIQSALRDGVVREVSQGVYVDVLPPGHRPADLTQVQASNDPQQGERLFDLEDEADWLADIEPLPQHAYDNTAARIVDGIAFGSFDVDSIATKLAVDAGIEPSLAAEYVNEGAALYQRTVDAALARQGLEGDELQACYAWMRDTKGPTLKNALQQLYLAADLGPLKKLASYWQTEQMRGSR